MDYDDASKEQKNRPGNGFLWRQSGTERAEGMERGKTEGRILEGREEKRVEKGTMCNGLQRTEQIWKDGDEVKEKGVDEMDST